MNVNQREVKLTRMQTLGNGRRVDKVAAAHGANQVTVDVPDARQVL